MHLILAAFFALTIVGFPLAVQHMKLVPIAIVVSILAATGAAADTEIHRCLLEDGTIAFQETPCPEPAVDVEDDVDDDFVNPFDEPANTPAPAEPTLPEPLTQDRAECEKTTLASPRFLVQSSC